MRFDGGQSATQRPTGLPVLQYVHVHVHRKLPSQCPDIGLCLLFVQKPVAADESLETKDFLIHADLPRGTLLGNLVEFDDNVLADDCFHRGPDKFTMKIIVNKTIENSNLVLEKWSANSE